MIVKAWDMHIRSASIFISRHGGINLGGGPSCGASSIRGYSAPSTSPIQRCFRDCLSVGVVVHHSLVDNSTSYFMSLFHSFCSSMSFPRLPHALHLLHSDLCSSSFLLLLITIITTYLLSTCLTYRPTHLVRLRGLNALIDCRHVIRNHH